MKLKQLLSDTSWQKQLATPLKSDTFSQLNRFLGEEYKSATIYPPKEDIFAAFNLTPFDKVRVVILGQDPYHGANQAHGLAFSVQNPCKPPPSLKNIFKELEIAPNCGDLTTWAQQGVLLLNTVLTVREAQAHSHKNKGWEDFTDAVIQTLSKQRDKIIFVLWGGPAQTKLKIIDTQKHLILQAPHPSPLSAYRGFFGCQHFQQINELLISQNETAIDWHIEDSEPRQPLLF
jgi:uracil-DNA glycosylase